MERDKIMFLLENKMTINQLNTLSIGYVAKYEYLHHSTNCKFNAPLHFMNCNFYVT